MNQPLDDVSRIADLVRNETRSQRLELQQRTVPPTAGELGAAEAALGAVLPGPYRRLVMAIGTGDFGSLELYSFDGGRSSVQAMNRSPLQPQPDFVAIADDGTGNYFGFSVTDGVCTDSISVLETETGNVRPVGRGLGDWFAWQSGLGRNPSE